MEGIPALEPAGSGDGEKALGKALAVFRLTAETYLTPLNGMTQCSFCGIVGGLDAFMENEGKEMLPLFEHLGGASTHGSILAGLVLLTVSLHPAPNEGSRLPELLAGDSLIDKGIPADEEALDFLEHVCGKPLRVRTATNLHERLEFPNKVGPAELPQAVFVVGSVGRVIIAGNDARENLAEDRVENTCASAGSNAEVDNQWRDKDPKGAAITFGFPCGFIDIESLSLGQSLPNLFHHRRRLDTDSLKDITSGAKGNVDSEYSIQNLTDTPPGSEMRRSEIACQGMDSGSEVALGHLLGQRSARSMTTGTLDLVAAIFRSERFDIRDLEDLVTIGSGSFPHCSVIQHQRAFLALIGVQIMDMVHFFDGEELSMLSLMTNLSTRLTAARSTFFPVDLGAIRRGRPIGVLRILPQPRFEFFNALGQLPNELMLLQDQRPYSGGRLFPVLFADGETLGKILHRHPDTLQSRLLFASCSIFQSPLHENLGIVPSKMHAWRKICTP